MIFKFTIWGAILMIFSCSAQNFKISEDGNIEGCPNITNEKMLEKCFGKTNYTSGKAFDLEGEEYSITTLFPKDEEKRLTISWKQKPTEDFSSINISGIESKWIVADKLRVGLSLTELRKINKEPFAISHYDFDDQGLILWGNGGELANILPGAKGKIFLEPKGELTDAQWRAISGTSYVCSEEVDKLEIELVITKIILDKYDVRPKTSSFKCPK